MTFVSFYTQVLIASSLPIFPFFFQASHFILSTIFSRLGCLVLFSPSVDCLNNPQNSSFCSLVSSFWPGLAESGRGTLGGKVLHKGKCLLKLFLHSKSNISKEEDGLLMPVFLVGGAVLAQKGLGLFPRSPLLLLQVFAGDKPLKFPLFLPEVFELEFPAGLLNLVLVLLFHLANNSVELKFELVLLLFQFRLEELSLQGDLLLDVVSVFNNETLLVLDHRLQLADFHPQKLAVPFRLLNPGVSIMQLILERKVDHLQRGVLLVGGVEGSVKLCIFPLVVFLNEENFVDELFVLGVVLGVEGKDVVYFPVYFPEGCRPLLPLLRLFRGQHAPFRPPSTQHYLLILNYIPIPQLLTPLKTPPSPFSPSSPHSLFVSPSSPPNFFMGNSVPPSSHLCFHLLLPTPFVDSFLGSFLSFGENGGK